MNKQTSRYKGKRKANYYSLAGFINNLSPTFGEDGIQQTGFGKGLGLNKNSAGLLGGLASAAGGIANSAISGGLSSDAGDAVIGVGSTIGGALSTVDPFLGGAFTFASNVLGGGLNALIGSKLNKQKIAEIETANEALANTQVDASSNSSILNQWAGQDWGLNFSQRDIGKDALWSSKAKDKYKQLLKGKTLAIDRAYNSYDNAIAMADTDQDNMLLQSHFEDGGDIKEKKSPRRVNFSTYKSTKGRDFVPAFMEQLQDSLIARRFEEPQRAAIMSNILQESGGDPKAVGPGGFKGIAQWGADRYPNTEDLGEQIHNLVETSLDYSSPNWTHGGAGLPTINSAKEGYNNFWNSNNAYDATMYYSKGYIRPKEEAARVNRAKEAVNMIRNMKDSGGSLQSNGTVWSNGLTFINNGGTHEVNPYEGVQVGVDQQGVPNLVEEGEVIWDDYVFSERLKVPKAFRDKYKLKGKDTISFAEAAEKFAEESKERPNDPISKRGRDTMLSLLKDQQEEVRMKKQQRQAKAQFNALSPEEQLGIMQMAQNAMTAGPEEGMNNIEGYPMYNQEAPLMAAYGGELGNVFDGTGDKPNKLKTNRMTRIYDLDWFKNKASSLDFDLGDNFKWDPTNYALNLDNFNKAYRDYQYQKAYDTYIAKQRQKWIDDEMASERYKRGDNGQNVYAAKYYGDADVGRDYINAEENRITADEYSKLKKADQANYKYSQVVKDQFMRDYNDNIMYDYNTDVSNTYIPDDATLEKGFKWDDKDALKISYGPQELSGVDNFLRYAPPIGSAVALADSMLTKPDYTSSNILMDAAVREGTANPIGYNLIGNYMSYKPFDRNLYTTKLSAEAAATRRAILNSSSPSRNAALLAADFNAQSKLGDLARQAEEYNLAQRQKVEDFNRGTNIANSEMALKTAMANMEENRRAKTAYTNNLTKAIALREQEDQQLAASRNANFNNFITNLGQIGEEAYTRNMIEGLIGRGTILDLFDRRTSANGGPIRTRKNKRRK